MVGLVQRGPHGGDVAGNTGGGLVVAGQNGLDPMIAIRSQNPCVFVDGHAFTPLALDGVDIQTLPAAQVDPSLREHPVPGREHLVTRRQRVRHRRLPAAGPGGGEQQHLAELRAEHRL